MHAYEWCNLIHDAKKLGFEENQFSNLDDLKTQFEKIDLTKNHKITKNFSLHELTLYSKYKKKNLPNFEQYINMAWGCIFRLQPLRDYFEDAIRINSCLRTATINAAVGGSATSVHQIGLGFDIEILGKSNAEWWNELIWLNYYQLFPMDLFPKEYRDEKFIYPFWDQLIFEKGNGESKDVNLGWIHLGLKPIDPNPDHNGKIDFLKKFRGQFFDIGSKNIIVHSFKNEALKKFYGVKESKKHSKAYLSVDGLMEELVTDK